MPSTVAGLLRPHDLDEALTAVADGTARPVAGATALLVDVARGAVAPAALVDLTTLYELTAVDPVAASGLGSRRIGAAVTLGRLVREGGALGAAAGLVASHPVRLRATIGGNITAPGWPHDLRTVLWAKGASIEVAGGDGRRRVGVALEARSLPAGSLAVALHVPHGPTALVAGAGITPGRPALQVVVNRATGRAVVAAGGWRRILPATGLAAASGEDVVDVLHGELADLGVPPDVAGDLARRSAGAAT